MYSAEVPHSRALTRAQVDRLILRHPHELFWKRALLRVTPLGSRRRESVVNALISLAETGSEHPARAAAIFSRWNWKDAERVAAAFERAPNATPGDSTFFLSRILLTVDDRDQCLAAARAAIDSSPARDDDFEWRSLVSLVLLQENPALFLKSFRKLTAEMKGLTFMPYRWATHAPPGSEAETRIRSRIAALPMYQRDRDGEVGLAILDGDRALARRDSRALKESVERIERFVPRALFSAERALAFLQRASAQRGARAAIERALKALLPTEIGAQAARLIGQRKKHQ